MKKNISFGQKRKFSTLSVVLFMLLIVYAITVIFSVYFILVTALKDVTDFDENFFGIPRIFSLDNIKEVLEYDIIRNRFGIRLKPMHFFPHIFLYTVLYSVGSAFFAALVPCITAYFVAKFNYKFSKILYALVVVVIIVPIIGNLPSTYRVLGALNLYDSIIGMYITKGNFVNMWFLVFYAAFKSVPNDYMEAAYIDGASEFRVMTTVMLPLVRNTFFTVVLIFFVDLWNDYTTPALFLPSHPTLAYMINSFANGTETGMTAVPIRMASCAIMVLPTLLIFVLFRNKLMGNLTMGGIKG